MADLAYLAAITAIHSTSHHGDDGGTSDSTNSGVTPRQRTGNSTTSSSNTLSRRSLSLLSRRFSRSGRRSMRSSSGNELVTAAHQSRRQSTATTAEAPSLHVRIVPNIEDPNRCLIFDVVDRELKAGETIRLGRFADRSPVAIDQMSFKTKVVSRSHCEIWVHDDGKLYMRDMGSSSGTFLNHVRLSQANQESGPVQIKHGDIVQLGVDYQGGQEETYRSVRMRFELTHERRPRPLSFSLSQFSNLKTLSRAATNSSILAGDTADEQEGELDECCICLYALAPFQALFVAPCSHSFHFTCIRTLLQSYPGFQCPICRTYSDLQACVAMEPEDILAKYGLRCKSYIPPLPPMPTDAAVVIAAATTDAHDHDGAPPAADSPYVTEEQQEQEQEQQTPFRQQQQQQHPPLTATTTITVTDIASQPPPIPPEEELPSGRDRRTVLISDDEDEPDDDDDDANDNDRDVDHMGFRQQRRASKWMGKLKKTFFEKNKSPVTMSPNERSNHARPLSYPNFLQRSSNLRTEGTPSGSS